MPANETYTTPKPQFDLWLPNNRDSECKIICKIEAVSFQIKLPKIIQNEH